MQLLKIKVKELNKKSIDTSIDVNYGDAIAEFKMKELGNQISSLNPKAIVIISFLTYSDVANTWMEMSSYYADEKKFVKY